MIHIIYSIQCFGRPSQLFQMLRSHGWLLATILDRTDREYAQPGGWMWWQLVLISCLLPVLPGTIMYSRISCVLRQDILLRE